MPYKGSTKGLSSSDLKNLDVIADHTDEIVARIATAKIAALEKIGLVAERHAKEIVREKDIFETGRLRNSITHTADENYAYIGTNVEYAPYHELGTSKITARPYLRPAAEDYMDEYRDILEKALDDG